MPDVINKSALFHVRSNSQLNYPPAFGMPSSNAAQWWEVPRVAAAEAAAACDEEAPTEEELEEIPCRDHLSYLHLVPSSHVRQLKLLAAIDERVLDIQTDSRHLLGSADEMEQDVRLSAMSANELFALVAFTFENGRDEVCVNILPWQRPKYSNAPNLARDLQFFLCCASLHSKGNLQRIPPRK